MSAETTAQQPDLIVQIDYKGIEFDPFAVDNDPVLSKFRNSRLADDGTLERMPDEWVLTWRSADGATNKHHLEVADLDAIDQARTQAKQHLRSVGYTPPTAGLRLVQFGSEPEPTGW